MRTLVANDDEAEIISDFTQNLEEMLEQGLLEGGNWGMYMHNETLIDKYWDTVLRFLGSRIDIEE